MLARLRSRLSYANVTATLALFVALGGTGAYAANTIATGDIIDNQVTFARRPRRQPRLRRPRGTGPGARSVRSSSCRQLHHELRRRQRQRPGDRHHRRLADRRRHRRRLRARRRHRRRIAQRRGRRPGHVRQLRGRHRPRAPQSCVYKDITGINAQGDHLLLTPNNNDSFLIYGIQYRSGQEFARLQICNPFTFTAQDETTHFNLLVIDAQ